MVGRAFDAAVGALMFLSSILSVRKSEKSVMSALCHERLTWPIDASRDGVAGWKAGREMASARALRWRGVVGFGLDYACAHIIIPASVNLLPSRFCD